MEQGWPGLAQYTPAVPADWSPRPRTVQDALDQLGGRSGGAGAATSYVWAPGGVAAPGVYVTWPTLVAAFALVPPQSRKIVAVDDALGAAHITTGAWANCDNIEFVSGGADSGPGLGIATIIVDQGATISGVAQMRLIGCNLEYNATSGACITTVANQNITLVVEGAELVGAGSGGNGFISAGAGATINFIGRVCQIAGQLFAGTATSIFNGSLGALCNFQAGVVNMTAGAVVALTVDGSSPVSAAQTPAPTITIVDPTATVVFQPGGTAGGNTYIDWAPMMAALALFQGPKTILVDDSLAAAHMTAGAWDLDNVTFRCNEASATFSLIVDEGATFTSTYLMVDGLLISSRTTSAAPWTPATFFSLRLFNGADLLCTAAATKPFLQVNAAATGSQVILDQGTALGDGVHNVIDVAGGQTLNVLVASPQFASGGLTAHAFGGTGTVAVVAGDGATVSATQDVTTFTTSFPTTPNLVQVANNTGTGTGTITITTGNISKKKSGRMLCTANIAGESTGPGTITLQLIRDAATNIGSPIAVTALSANDDFSLSLTFVDTAPDTAAHTYKFTATASAGNITCAATSGQLTVVEL